MACARSATRNTCRGNREEGVPALQVKKVGRWEKDPERVVGLLKGAGEKGSPLAASPGISQQESVLF